MASHFRTHRLTEAQHLQERIHQLENDLSDEKAYVKSTEEALIEAQDELKAMHESANIAAGEIMRLRQENRQQHRDLRMTEGVLRDATTSAIYLCRSGIVYHRLRECAEQRSQEMITTWRPCRVCVRPSDSIRDRPWDWQFCLFCLSHQCEDFVPKLALT